MANEKLYSKSTPPQIEGVDPFYVDRELTKIEQGFSKIENVVSEIIVGGTVPGLVDQDARDDIANLTTRVSTLEVTEGNALALIEEERSVRASADEAEALARLTLKAQVDENTAEIVNEQLARVNGDAALASQVTTLNTDYQGNKASVSNQLTTISSSQLALSQQVATFSSQIALNSALIEEETTARVTEDEALAQRITTFQTEYDGNKASVQNQITALTNADLAQTQTTTTLRADFEFNKSVVSEQLTALATADSATATQISSLSVQANRSRTYRQSTAPTGAQIGDLWFDTANSNRPYRYDGGGWQETSDTRISAAEASITNEATVRASADSALANQINTVSSSVGNLSATVSTFSQSINGLNAKWGVRINNNGAVTGIELNSGANATSEFKVQADKFIIAPQSGGGTVPFRVEGNTTYIEDAVIKNGTVSQVFSTNFNNDTFYGVFTLAVVGVPAGTPILVLVSNAYIDGPGVFFNSGGLRALNSEGNYEPINNTYMNVITAPGGNMFYTCYNKIKGSIVFMALKK